MNNKLHYFQTKLFTRENKNLMHLSKIEPLNASSSILHNVWQK